MKVYKLYNMKTQFMFYESEDLNAILNYADNISTLRGSEGIMTILNELQAELGVSENHKKSDFPLLLINLVLNSYGLKIYCN